MFLSFAWLFARCTEGLSISGKKKRQVKSEASRQETDHARGIRTRKHELSVLYGVACARHFCLLFSFSSFLQSNPLLIACLLDSPRANSEKRKAGSTGIVKNLKGGPEQVSPSVAAAARDYQSGPGVVKTTGEENPLFK